MTTNDNDNSNLHKQNIDSTALNTHCMRFRLFFTSEGNQFSSIQLLCSLTFTIHHHLSSFFNDNPNSQVIIVIIAAFVQPLLCYEAQQPPYFFPGKLSSCQLHILLVVGILASSKATGTLLVGVREGKTEGQKREMFFHFLSNYFSCINNCVFTVYYCCC